MAPKKQAKPNAYSLFVQDFKNQQGKKFASMKEAFEAAAPHWARMTKDQKRPYEEQAKRERGHGVKLTSEGLDVDKLTNQKKEEEEYLQQMRVDIGQTIRMAVTRGDLEGEMFFTIHVNIFCYSQAEDLYYPAEIAVVAFNLREGVKPANVFHFLVKSGALPMGYSFEAKQHSDQTHQIKIPLAGENENNTQEVFDQLLQFLAKKYPGFRKNPIVLYAENKNIKLIQAVLDYWSDDPNLFRVYSLQYMFTLLRNTAANDNVWHTDTFSDREIEKDVNDFATQIACVYHENSSVSRYCSKSIATRYAYTICDNCCPDLDIELIPGQHVAFKSVMEPMGSSRASSVLSFSTENSYRNPRRSRRIQDDDSASTGFSSSDAWENQSVTSEASSTMTSVNTEENFPLLAETRVETPESFFRFTPNDSSSLMSKNSSSVKSYAGATVKSSAGLSSRPVALPSAFEKDMDNLSLSSSSDFPSIGVGRGDRRHFDTSSIDDFPGIGKGRGFAPPKGRGFRRPNQGSS